MSFWLKLRDRNQTGRAVWYSISGFEYAFALVALILLFLFFFVVEPLL